MFPWLFLLLQISALGTALLGGVFLAFSDFLMRALAKSAPAAGMEAMQQINREVFRYVFMTLFLGLVPVSVLLAVLALTAMEGDAATLTLVAAGIYLLGVFGVTAARNVPLNNRLAAMDHREADAQAFWRGTYVPRWTAWNSLRAGACIASAGVFMAAAAVGAG